MSAALGRLAREPLLHFLVLGAVLYALDVRRPAPDVNVIHLPADADDAQAREEVLVREALAMGLHLGDGVVRRRLVQRMELLLGDLSEPPPPDDDALRAWLAADPGRYAAPPRLTLEHRFFDPARPDAEARAASLDPDRGDAFPHPLRLVDATPEALDRTFGPGFGDAVLALEPGAWRGPLRSALGLHIVRVASVTPGRPGSLEQDRERLARDWSADAKARALEQRVEALRARYTVVRDPP